MSFGRGELKALGAEENIKKIQRGIKGTEMQETGTSTELQEACPVQRNINSNGRVQPTRYGRTQDVI